MSISPPPLKRRRLDQPATLTHHTVYSWNVNGIDPLLQTSIAHFLQPSRVEGNKANAPASPIRDFLQRHGWPTVCFLQEVKIAATDSGRQRAVRRAVSNRSDESLPDYEAHFCLPAKDRFVTTKGGGRFYGVCTLIRKEYAQRYVKQVRSVDWDNEGRILIAETQRVDNLPKLAMINVYMVNGTDLQYRSNVGGEIVGTRHQRKLKVHALLQTECARLEADDFAVIIAGDINVARSELDGHPRLRTHPHQHVINRADFEHRFLTCVPEEEGPQIDDDGKNRSAPPLGSKVGNTTSDVSLADASPELDVEDQPSQASTCAGSSQVPAPWATANRPLGMYDTFRELHPDKRGYSYFSRSLQFGESCDRVDMIIVSRSIISTCVQAGMHETPADRSTSDHVPIYAVFDWSLLHEKGPSA